MRSDDCPDVLGWELPRALEELRALGIPVSHRLTCPPRKLQNSPESPDASALDYDEEACRVVAVRRQSDDSIMLIVCMETW